MMRSLLAALAVLLALAPQRVDALLCTPVLGCTCTVTASDIDFASFTPFAGPQDASGVVQVSCSGVIDVAPAVLTELDDGQWGSYAQRKMRTASGDELGYNIYTTSQRNVVWGNGSSGTSAVWISGGVVTLGNWSRSTTMFARAAPNAASKPGNYSDTVVVRVVW